MKPAKQMGSKIYLLAFVIFLSYCSGNHSGNKKDSIKLLPKPPNTYSTDLQNMDQEDSEMLVSRNGFLVRADENLFFDIPHIHEYYDTVFRFSFTYGERCLLVAKVFNCENEYYLESKYLHGYWGNCKTFLASYPYAKTRIDFKIWQSIVKSLYCDSFRTLTKNYIAKQEDGDCFMVERVDKKNYEIYMRNRTHIEPILMNAYKYIYPLGQLDTTYFYRKFLIRNDPF